MPNGTRMAADVVSYYNEKCLGGLVMSLFKFQAGIKLFEHMEDTVICHGYVKLLSLIDAYQWTEEMCENKVIEDERAHFCERYDDDQKNIEELANRYGAIGYNDLTTIAKVLSALEGEGKCKDFCGGIMNSVLCGSFVDASRFFLDKFESDPPEKITIEEVPDTAETKSLYSSKPSLAEPHPSRENPPLIKTPAVKPARPGIESTGDDARLKMLIKEALNEFGHEKDKGESTPAIEGKLSAVSPSVNQPSDTNKEAGENADDAPPPSGGDTEKSETAVSSAAPTTEDTPTEPPQVPIKEGNDALSPEQPDNEPPDSSDANGPPIEAVPEENPEFIGDGLLKVLRELKTTEGDLLNLLGSEFQEDLRWMTYEDIMDSVEEKLEEEELEEELSPGEVDLEAELAEGGGYEDYESQLPEVNKIPELGVVKGEEPGKKDEEEVTSGRSYGSWHFFTIIVVLAVAVIGGYLCVHNRKKLRESVGSYMSDSKHRRRRTREYKPLIGQT